MEMGDGLAGVRAVVHDEAKAVGELEFFREHAGDEQEVAEGGLVGEGGFADARDEFFRDDEEVNRGRGLDVVEDDAVFILVLDAGRDFAVDDALENCLGHGKSELNRKDAKTQSFKPKCVLFSGMGAFAPLRLGA